METIKEARLTASVDGKLVYVADVMPVRQDYLVGTSIPKNTWIGFGGMGTTELKMSPLFGTPPDDLCTICITPCDCDHQPFSFKGKFRPEGFYGITEIDVYSIPEASTLE